MVEGGAQFNTLMGVILSQAANAEEVRAVAEVIKNRSVSKGKSAYEIVTEPDQFAGLGAKIIASKLPAGLYASTSEVVHSLMAGTYAENSHPGAYFFSRIEGDIEGRSWAVGKVAPCGQVGHLYLTKWK